MTPPVAAATLTILLVAEASYMSVDEVAEPDPPTIFE
jgi:hypothetical protein